MSDMESKPQDDAPKNADSNKAAIDSVVNRRTRWRSSFAALKYVNSVQRDEEIKVRDSDKATAISLVFCCAGMLVCIIVPGFEAHRVTFMLAADALVGLSLLMYVANRFGIVTTFAPRQALLTWQLMLGSSLLGIFMTINLAMVIASIIQNSKFLAL